MNHSPIPAPAADPSGRYYSVRFDPDSKIIRAVTRDFWTLDIMAAYLDDIGRICQASIRNFGHAWVLVDRREMPVQAAEVNALAERSFSQVKTVHKVAVVGEVGLRQLQMRRATAEHTTAFFQTPEEAEAWLLNQ